MHLIVTIFNYGMNLLSYQKWGGGVRKPWPAEFFTAIVIRGFCTTKVVLSIAPWYAVRGCGKLCIREKALMCHRRQEPSTGPNT